MRPPPLLLPSLLPLLLACASGSSDRAQPAAGASSGATSGGPAGAVPGARPGAAPGASPGRPASPAAGPASPAPVEVIPVNRGTHGMAARTRWALSPDQRALLVVEDPAAVENDALPNGFVYASEATGAIVQQDGVWDVTPSPAWTRLAWSRAIVVRAGEQDSVPPAEWRRALAQLPEDAFAPLSAGVPGRGSDALLARLRASAFPVSGMAVMYGLGLAQAMDVSRLGAGRLAVVAGPTVALDAWRVRWTRAGDTLVVGAAPRTVNDDATAARWLRAAPAAPGAIDSSRLARVAWTQGPTIDISVPIPLGETRELRSDAALVRSSGGTIRVRSPNAASAAWREVGPGLALAATAGGRFIVAARRKADAAQYEAPFELVVYHVPRP